MTKASGKNTGTVEPTKAEVAAVRRLVEEVGELAAGAKLGISRSAVTRLRGGLPVRNGTMKLARLGLEAAAS